MQDLTLRELLLVVVPSLILAAIIVGDFVREHRRRKQLLELPPRETVVTLAGPDRQELRDAIARLPRRTRKQIERGARRLRP